MVAVSITDLKARLSHYLRLVKRGGEIQILDRGIPVARLTSIAGDDTTGADRDRRDRLIRAGLLRAGKGNAGAVLAEAPISLSTSLTEALEADRGDRF